MAESAEDNALYWVEPEQRGVIPLDGFHVVADAAQARCARQPSRCGSTRDFDQRDRRLRGADGRAGASTWINGRIRALYTQLHRMGCCHSVEAWQRRRAGRRALRRAASARRSSAKACSRARRDASKVALVHLVARLNAGGFGLLDAQFVNPHLERFGAIAVPRDDYHRLLEPALRPRCRLLRLPRGRRSRGSARLARASSVLGLASLSGWSGWSEVPAGRRLDSRRRRVGIAAAGEPHVVGRDAPWR